MQAFVGVFEAEKLVESISCCSIQDVSKGNHNLAYMDALKAHKRHSCI